MMCYYLNVHFQGQRVIIACEGSTMLRYEYVAVLHYTYNSYLDVLFS